MLASRWPNWMANGSIVARLALLSVCRAGIGTITKETGMTKKTYRVDEAAVELGVSKRTIERAIQSQEIQSYKIRDTRRIEAQEIERLKRRERREV